MVLTELEKWLNNHRRRKNDIIDEKRGGYSQLVSNESDIEDD